MWRIFQWILRFFLYPKYVNIPMEPKVTEELKELKRLAKAVAMRESSGNYEVVNTLGYMGAYQFGMPRLCDLGYTKREGDGFVWVPPYNKNVFLTTPVIQDIAFYEHVIDLIPKVAPYLKYTEDYTISGLVMGAHLAGMGGVDKYFKRHHDSKDMHGTSIVSYMEEFSGYKIV